uniref:Uncharacterized protein n=1 Tax=Opuntia streptacantha TaxID=393608 RepID=A0A7C8ZM36_OPUST
MLSKRFENFPRKLLIPHRKPPYDPCTPTRCTISSKRCSNLFNTPSSAEHSYQLTRKSKRPKKIEKEKLFMASYPEHNITPPLHLTKSHNPPTNILPPINPNLQTDSLECEIYTLLPTNTSI